MTLLTYTSFNFSFFSRPGADYIDVSLPDVGSDAEEDAEDAQAHEHTHRAQLKPKLGKFPPGFRR